MYPIVRLSAVSDQEPNIKNAENKTALVIRSKMGRPRGTPVIPVLAVLREERHGFDTCLGYSEFELSLGCIVCFRPD